MTIAEIIMVIAILLGPAFGVWLANRVDEKKERRRRREDIFKTLMRTRRDPISLEHVGALNLVELEFADKPEVLAAFKKLFEHFGEIHKQSERETIDEFNLRLFQERQRLLAKLLHQMAKALGFEIEQLEIFEGGYIPQGWQDERTMQKYLQLGLGNVISGNTPLKVALINPVEPNEEKGSNNEGTEK